MSPPLEFLDFSVLESLLQDLGQVPYGWKPPNGYPDVAGAWMNTTGLLARWNVAMALTHSAHSEPESGMISRIHEVVGNSTTVAALVDTIAYRVFAVPLPEELRTEYIDYASDGAGAEMPVDAHLLARKLASLFGMMLASPYFQWR